MSSGKPSDKQLQIEEALAPYLKAHLDGQPTPHGVFARIARECEVTPGYVSQIWNRLTGGKKRLSLTQYIADLREREEAVRTIAAMKMSEAAIALESALTRKDAPVDEIARLRKSLANADAVWRSIK